MRILLIEDDQTLRTFLAQELKKAYFVIDSAADGEKGAQLGRTNDYDLIILDINLPKKSGPEVCRLIREKNKKVIICVLSVLTDIPTKVDLLNMGADDYITKPFSLEELVARIRALLRRPPPVCHTILTALDLTLDIVKHRVTRGKKDIRLTPKEFMLLEYLMKHEGEVVSRSTLLEHVWDENADPFTNTIETHMTTLRKKIDSDHARKLIHTIPGVGYILKGKK